MAESYATAAEVRERSPELVTGVASSEIERALDAASRKIDAHCDRHFFQVAATRLIPHSRDGVCLEVPDIVHGQITSIKVDTTDDGVFDLTLSASDYEVLPPSGDFVAGEQGPITEVRMVGSYRWPTGGRRSRRVEIVGTFGWGSVPADVVQACLELTAMRLKTADAPLGVAGFGDFGALRVRDMPHVKSMLQPFCRHGAYVA